MDPGILNFLFVVVIVIIAALIKSGKRKGENKGGVSQSKKDAARENLHARERTEAEPRRRAERVSPVGEREKAAYTRAGGEAAETDYAFPSAPPVGVDDREAQYQLKQLDRFLESGLIDKEEYRVLKKKIEGGR